MQKLVMLELNEVNFEFVEWYIANGKLPGFKSLLQRYGYSKTISESRYENLEPWIQWVSAHTGLSFAEHQVFRLGDIRQQDVRQIWEHLEADYGLSVAAISPMNADNRTENSSFFVPDPWTGGTISGPAFLSRFYAAIAAAVNQNAYGSAPVAVYLDLLQGLVRFGRLKSLFFYLSCVARIFSGRWRKALFLDRLLADTFITLWRRSQPDYSTLFLNAAAHIQHHYMFSAAAYRGELRNPEWYAKRDVDPLLEVYELYDSILIEILKLDDARVMVATGLHQDPHDDLSYYYRLVDHGSFLEKLGVSFRRIETRMSRDFFVFFDSTEQAKRAADVLDATVAPDGERVFYIENRGQSLFVMLTYPNEITPRFQLTTPVGKVENFDKDVAFVAIKNGEHNGVGYFVDTGAATAMANDSFPITEIYHKTVKFFDSRSMAY